MKTTSRLMTVATLAPLYLAKAALTVYVAMLPKEEADELKPQPVAASK